jgi:hypothetical protein
MYVLCVLCAVVTCRLKVLIAFVDVEAIIAHLRMHKGIRRGRGGGFSHFFNLFVCLFVCLFVLVGYCVAVLAIWAMLAFHC